MLHRDASEARDSARLALAVEVEPEIAANLFSRIGGHAGQDFGLLSAAFDRGLTRGSALGPQLLVVTRYALVENRLAKWTTQTKRRDLASLAVAAARDDRVSEDVRTRLLAAASALMRPR
jgi:hypothetical protein